MRDLIAASGSAKKLREKMQAIGRSVVNDSDPQPLIDEAEVELQKLAFAMGFSLMRVRDVEARS